MDPLLSIGEFSERCGLSAKMLRTYAAAGVLVPAAVDPNTGYRYYALGQLPVAKVIAALRRARVPLAEIASFLADQRDDALERSFDRWERDLTVELRTRHHALTEARRLMASVDDAITAAVTRPRTPGAPLMSSLIAGSATDIGRVRTQNQDGTIADDRIVGVADGLGGGGELASMLALETLRAAFAADPTASGLIEACHEANRVVWARAQEGSELAKMGTTLTAAALVTDGSGIAVVNIGDSRAYLHRAGELRRVTRDHSLVEDLVETGQLTEAEARVHPQRHILTRVLGMGPAIEPDLVEVTVQDGDRLLLCTDGLINEVDERSMADVLATVSDARRAAADLVQLASTNGGHDNASAVVIDIVIEAVVPKVDQSEPVTEEMVAFRD